MAITRRERETADGHDQERETVDGHDQEREKQSMAMTRRLRERQPMAMTRRERETVDGHDQERERERDSRWP